MNPANWPLSRLALALVPLGCAALLTFSFFELALARELFVHGTYFLLMGAVVCWAGVHLHAVRSPSWEAALGWLQRNWPGVTIAVAVTAIVGIAVEPALRVLSDEANLVGTSKNLFASKSATFTVSGKYYYESNFDVDVAIDRRPVLFPFLVSLLHAVRGYSHENAFLLNLLLLPAFVLGAYRLAKSLAGERFAVLAALLVAAHPVTLISVRSAGFDFLAACLGVLVLGAAVDHLKNPQPGRLAVLWMNLCLFANVRYESALFIPPVLLLLSLFGRLRREHLGPYALVYALTPAFFLPRLWQGLLRGNVPEQEPGAVTFSFENFLRNAGEYLAPLASPFSAHHVHSVFVLGLGLLGCLAWSLRTFVRWRARADQALELRIGALVIVWMVVQVVIVFTYVWGRAQYPSAARLMIPIDTFLSFMAAGLLARWSRRSPPFVGALVAAALFLSQLPVAAQHRLLNRLTQTRESAATWRFFERLDEKRILIVTDRPNHFTIMNYGAMSFQAAQNDPYLFTALERRLFQDVYVIQSIQLSTMKPLPGFEIWPDRPLETVFEFQNDANVLVRVSRVAR